MANQLQCLGGLNAAHQALQRLLSEDSAAAGKVRQLWLYSLMQQERAEAHGPEHGPAHGPGPVQAAIVSLRPESAAAPLYLTTNLSFLAEAYDLPPTPEGQRQASETALGELVRRILDPAEPLRRTANVKTCAFCDFRRVCAR